MLKMVRPSRARFLMAAQPQPLMLSVPQPEAEVFELYRRIAAPGRPSFLLESGKGSSGVARWSFFGSDPYLELSGKGARYELRTRDGSTVHKGDPFKALAELIRASRMPRPDDAPPFIGGAVGYFSYDLIRQFENLPKCFQRRLPGVAGVVGALHRSRPRRARRPSLAEARDMDASR